MKLAGACRARIALPPPSGGMQSSLPAHEAHAEEGSECAPLVSSQVMRQLLPAGPSGGSIFTKWLGALVSESDKLLSPST